MGKRAVVGQNQESRCVFVKPAAWEKAEPSVLVRQQVEYGPFGYVVGGGDHALRLVHHEIDIFLIMNAASEIRDLVVFRVDRKGGIGNGIAVDGDAAGPCGLTAFRAGGRSGFGQEFVKTHMWFPFGKYADIEK